MKKYYTYIIKCSDSSYYTGVTHQIKVRERQHNEGLTYTAYTFKRRPVKLVWYQEFTTPDEAIIREKQIKGWRRAKKEALIRSDFDALPLLASSRLRQAQTDNKIIVSKLPYVEPFLFVDGIETISAEGITGHYTFSKDAFFYRGHFKNYPVTPGVILTECCAQIGLVALGIYLLGSEASTQNLQLAFSSSEMEFLKPVFPGEKVMVVSEKLYFRFGKLKCKVKMYNTKKELVCSGFLSGMLTIKSDEA